MRREQGSADAPLSGTLPVALGHGGEQRLIRGYTHGIYQAMKDLVGIAVFAALCGLTTGCAVGRSSNRSVHVAPMMDVDAQDAGRKGGDAATTFGNVPPMLGQGGTTQLNTQSASDLFQQLKADDFAKAVAAQRVVDDKTKREESLDGFNFGTGIAAGFDLHRGQRIDSASIGPNASGQSVVRVDKEAETRLGLVLETHYFWTVGQERLIGLGPFFAIKSSDSDLIQEAGLGFMIGLRHNKEATNSFNIGLGVMVDPSAKVLADGFSAGAPPPPGATSVATKEETRFSAVVLFSYTF